MRAPVSHRVVRLLAALGLAGALLLPALAVPARAADEKLVLRVGTVQDLDSLNPYQTLLVSGYEVFQLTYNLLVDFGPDLEPVPGFADKWERAADGKSWTFHIRTGMKWSDGTPATAQDACYSWGIAVAAVADEASIGAGYLDPGLKDAGVTKVECPDDETMIATTEDASDRILQTYLPILPRHIWGDKDYTAIGEAKFEAPLVGTGPYTVAEWRTSEYARFVRNPDYWGTQGAADEVVIQFFKNADTMVQALKAGEIDYARNPNSDQLKALQGEPGITTLVGSSNGWTQLAFNGYGASDGKTIEGGGPSTTALLDPAFRDALGYAVDKKVLVDRVLGGFGDVGTTIVPPVLGKWHVEPTTPRTFDLDLARQKLDAAGYKLDANGARLDKEGKAISLRLYMPDTDDAYPKAAQFIKDWYAELGVRVSTQVFDSSTLGNLVLPPEAGAEYKADYDIELWGWAGNPDPNALLQIFRCDAIGSSSDSQYCNPEFDAMFDAQTAAATAEERKTILAKMQNLVYDQAVYDILFYDANLAAYRTDKFGGWQNQPLANGTPLFTYGTLQYTLLTDATAVPSPTAAPSAEPGASATPAPTPAPSGSGGTDGTGGDSTALYIGILVAVLVVAGVVLAMVFRRRQGAAGDEE
ncbi:MAG TPA: ABC transporter substrate-binding protein [Candidatus Nanopelagicales bacterium]|nr:ABC transporter substrate-binding protein [Candidatus Nanopelagicales bacterium]